MDIRIERGSDRFLSSARRVASASSSSNESNMAQIDFFNISVLSYTPNPRDKPQACKIEGLFEHKGVSFDI